jgi:nicotinate-nucleotide adenylyltransferase
MGVGDGFHLGPNDRRVGVLGGTFDPIHYGHLVVAEEVRELLSLDRVVFIPAASPPHKRGIAMSPVQDRAAMVELAIAGNSTFAMSRVEMNREGLSYTADTLALLAAQAARQKVARELFFILSAEALALLPEWHEPRRVLELAHLVVVPRPGSPVPTPAEIGARFGDQAGRVLAVDTLPLAHSASDIRRRGAAGRTIRYLVPPAVEAYICDHHLYRPAGASSAANEDPAK